MPKGAEERRPDRGAALGIMADGLARAWVDGNQDFVLGELQNHRRRDGVLMALRVYEALSAQDRALLVSRMEASLEETARRGR
jgi:hypothetical protein